AAERALVVECPRDLLAGGEGAGRGEQAGYVGLADELLVRGHVVVLEGEVRQRVQHVLGGRGGRRILRPPGDVHPVRVTRCQRLPAGDCPGGRLGAVEAGAAQAAVREDRLRAVE